MVSHPAWKALIFVLLSMGWAAQALAGVYFIHTDHLGTPRVVSDQVGTVVWKADYDAFGKAALTTNVYALNLRFPGQYFDAETNLHYNYFRDYDPSVGRYLQSDPIGLEGGINTYAYALNNPLRYVDPSGETTTTWGGFAGSSGEAAAGAAGARGLLGWLGPVGAVLGGFWPTEMGDATLDGVCREDDCAAAENKCYEECERHLGKNRYGQGNAYRNCWVRCMKRLGCYKGDSPVE